MSSTRLRSPVALLALVAYVCSASVHVIGDAQSSEIYGTPKDPALKKEYDEYLKKRLEEIRKRYQE
jgi:hypothetical protein